MKCKWIILAAIAVIGTGIFLYIKFQSSTDFEPLIKNKLKQIIADASDSLYQLEIGKINIDILSSQVVIADANLIIDSGRLAILDNEQMAPDDVYKISFKNLVVDGIGPDDLLKKNNINLDILYIKEPVVEIFHHKRAYNYKPADTISLYKKIAKEVGHVSVNNLWVQKINFSYHNVTNNNKLTHLENMNIHFKDMLIDSTTQNDSTRFLYAKDAAISLVNYNLITRDSLYIFHIDSVAVNASMRRMDITSLSLQPRGEKNNFSKKLKFYKDRYDISIRSVSAINIDWYQLLSEEGFNADQVNLLDGDIEIFADVALPGSHKKKVGNYPHQLLMNLKVPIDVKAINIDHFKVTYTELSEKTKKKGSLVFSSIKGTFSNVTNIPENISQHNFAELNAHAMLMDKVPLDALFKFDLAKNNTGNFYFDMHVQQMDGTILNPVTTALGLFEIKEATISRIDMHMQADDYKANGNIFFYYKDLKIALLKKEDGQPQLKERGFLSFLANTFVIQPSNTADDNNKDPKAVNYKRDPERSFFNLIWKTLFTGVSQTIKGKNE